MEQSINKTLTKAQKIKILIKEELGYNRNMVSLKESPGGLSYSFTFTIRDPRVDIEKVSAFLATIVQLDRCDSSGEILSGGNTYVHLTLTESTLNTWAKEYKTILSSATPNKDSNGISYHINDNILLSLESSSGKRPTFSIIQKATGQKFDTPTYDTIHVSFYMYLLEKVKFNRDLYRSINLNLQLPISY